MNRLQGKVALITGATSGIGEASAQLFAEEGAKVVIAGRNPERGWKIKERLVSAGLEAQFIQCDVSSSESARTLVDETIGTYGQLDILFNNAGVFLPSVEIERLEIESWKETFSVNVDGLFFVTKYAKMHLIKQGGVILNNSSVAGMQSYAAGRSYAYSASKSAVIQFSHLMAKNYAEEGVRVNCICPGVIHTPILHGRDPNIYAERIPMKRVGDPKEVAQVALFLVSEESSYITGAVLPIDGGASL